MAHGYRQLFYFLGFKGVEYSQGRKKLNRLVERIHPDKLTANGYALQKFSVDPFLPATQKLLQFRKAYEIRQANGGSIFSL